MAYNRPVQPGVLSENIHQAVTRIQASLESVEFERQASDAIGIYQNQWQRPITEYGDEDPQWVVNIKQSPHVGDIDFGRKEWARSREAVDTVMELLLIELRHHAEKYERLRIDSYIRQGSSRDGLKVIAPDEFDTILEFHFEGLNMKQVDIRKPGSQTIPGFCYLAVDGKTMADLQTRYPALSRDDVFQQSNSTVYVNSESLHKKVFISLVDRACNSLTEKLVSFDRKSSSPSNFRITRKSNPPSVNITITLNDDAHRMFMRQGQPKSVENLVKEIDVDIVPGLRLATDETTFYEGVRLNCPIHAVCKWSEEESHKAPEFAQPCLLWDIKTAGYERHILDVARKDRRKLYILTALRIIKTYFCRTKKIAAKAGHAPPTLVTVIKSYHLKQLTMYLLYYLCHKHPNFKLYGAKKAVLYFIDILEASFEKGRLPHFFYSNPDVQQMLPGFPTNHGYLRYDFYRNIHGQAIQQAEKSLFDHMATDLGFNFGGVGGGDEERATVLDDFKRRAGGSDYF